MQIYISKNRPHIIRSEDGKIQITEANHRFDLTDLPSYLVDALRESKVCLADFEEKLMREEVIYGARTAGGSETATASEESKW